MFKRHQDIFLILLLNFNEYTFRNENEWSCISKAKMSWNLLVRVLDKGGGESWNGVIFPCMFAWIINHGKIVYMRRIFLDKTKQPASLPFINKKNPSTLFGYYKASVHNVFGECVLCVRGAHKYIP